MKDVYISEGYSHTSLVLEMRDVRMRGKLLNVHIGGLHHFFLIHLRVNADGMNQGSYYRTGARYHRNLQVICRDKIHKPVC